MKLSLSTRIVITVTIIILVGGMLLWEYFNGGVKTHYFLQDDSFPGISNYWGLLVAGVLTWFTLYRIKVRKIQKSEEKQETILKKAFIRFLVALFFGITLSIFFSLGYAQVAEAMTLGILLLSFFIPLYKTEYLLGYVLGLAFTIGATLPAFFGLIIITICWLTYTLPRWVFLKLNPRKI